MSSNETIIRFDEVSFAYSPTKPILDEVDLVVRRGAKLALMGQNGAGKSTIFSLITSKNKPEDGMMNVVKGVTIAKAHQVMAKEDLERTVREFFQACFAETIYDIDPRIDEVLEVVNFSVPHDKQVGSLSGGQQARLLLAGALIQKPDVLLLDEPTNNLDKEGVEHLTKFLVEYTKTVIVISHDADFLNAFTQGVLYLDVFTKKVEQYVGNYKDVLREITIRVEKERQQNARLEKHIKEKKEKANFFANKGGRMRVLAKKMRESAQEAEDNKVDVRREDKAIRPFTIPAQPDLSGEIIGITSLTVIRDHKPKPKKVNISLYKKQHLLLSGPNGVGKTTLLESLANGTAEGARIASGVEVGYYRQDFSTLDFEKTVYDTLAEVMQKHVEQDLRSAAAGFLLDGKVMYIKVGDLSEGQKGLVAFCRLMLQRPGLLILDEPTNHINFRHIPIIAKALDKYEGAMILVSHVPEFVKQVRIDEVLDLHKK
jgi:ATP-binding cassette subfamily F protein 3